MKTVDKVCTLKQAKKLYELGFKAKTEYVWIMLCNEWSIHRIKKFSKIGALGEIIYWALDTAEL